MKRSKNVFIVWKIYQRRAEVLAPLLGIDVYYLYYSWEDKNRVLKALSYILKGIAMFKYLFEKMPALVFIQFPPAPALYCAALYCWLTGALYVSDCHLGITNSSWLRMPFVRTLLAQGIVVIHNEHLVELTKRELGVEPVVLRDGIASIDNATSSTESLLQKLALSPYKYVIAPCSFSPDEPMQEIIDAARLLPSICFVLTWCIEKLSQNLRNILPANIILTGFLPVEQYNLLFAKAGAAVVLTMHEAVQLSGMQEAMAFQVPAVVSDLNTTRFLYKDFPIYVKNEAQSIADGVVYALQHQNEMTKRMNSLRIEAEKEFFLQVHELRMLLYL